MARSDGARRWARRWARWLAAHRWRQHGVRWLLMTVVGMPLVIVLAAGGLPDWTPAIVVALVLVMDDAVGRYVKRWSAAPEPRGGEQAPG